MSSAVPQQPRSKTPEPTIAATPQLPPLVPAIRPKSAPPPRPLHPIIEIINGYKHFGFSKKWHQVMRNVNLMAYAGQVYVLLGPHGSGKSSILDVILGFTALNNGCINVFGVRPGRKGYGCPGPRIGYTPQSGGLFKHMTINETFKYYGNMLGLKSNYINQRICYLHDLLALPLGKLYISQCDENQKRQISFAIAILHEPELLLLDEPCQGVDPVCRTNIWDHLKTLVDRGVTVFLTTQHLPDANRADRLGILRNGYLLMEGSPAELINDYKENSIETLYTSIYSLRIKKGTLTEKKSIHEHPRVKLERITAHGSEGFLYVEEPAKVEAKQNERHDSKKAPVRFHCGKTCMKFLPNCKRLATLLSRDIRLSFRCYTWLLTVCLVPIILLVLFTFTVGEHPKNLKIGVVNFETHDDCSRQNVSEKYVSCQVLGQIDKSIIQTKDYKKYDDAKSDAYNMKISAILVIGEKFTNQLVRMLAGVVSNQVLEQSNPNTPQLILQMDMTNKVVATAIERAIKRAVEKYLQMATRQSTVQNATVGYPMVVEKPIFGDENSADTEFICLALTVVFLYYLASFLAATTMVSYRVCHLAVRDYVAGVRLIESILSQMVVYGLLLVIEAILMYLVLALIRNLIISITWQYLTLVVFVQVWCGLCFGFFVASVTKSGVQAGCIVFCCLSASMILCGVLWPLNGQPHWLLTIVNLLPHTQAITAVRCIIQKGISINHEEVYLGIVIPLVWLILFVLLTYIFTKY